MYKYHTLKCRRVSSLEHGFVVYFTWSIRKKVSVNWDAGNPPRKYERKTQEETTWDNINTCVASLVPCRIGGSIGTRSSRLEDRLRWNGVSGLMACQLNHLVHAILCHLTLTLTQHTTKCSKYELYLSFLKYCQRNSSVLYFQFILLKSLNTLWFSVEHSALPFQASPNRANMPNSAHAYTWNTTTTAILCLIDQPKYKNSDVS